MNGILTSLALNVILITIFVLAIPYIKFGFAVLFGKLRWKSNTAVMFIRSRANNFPMPYIFDNSKESFKKKLGGQVLTFPILKDEKPALTFLGMPAYFRDIEDSSNDLGLIYADPENPEALRIIKHPNYIRSEEIEIILNNQKLMSTVKTLLDNYQVLFMMVIGLLIAVLFNVYVSWELLSFINNFDFGGI
jgi:hypothetical protein